VAQACAFHGYKPNPTLVDMLMATEDVVLARPSRSDPDLYVPLKTLRGHEVSQITVPVDPGLAAPLRGNAENTMLMARDGAYGPWLELAVLDDGYRRVVEQILARQTEWYYGGDQARVQFFAKRLNDANPAVRQLALLELDRVPYGMLRSLRLPKVAGLRADLAAKGEALLPIRVLLAGLSKDPSFRAPLQAGMERAIARDAPYLGAFATALIELDGPPAVQIILARLSEDESLSSTHQEQLLEALAIQYRGASIPLRRAIAEEVADLSRRAPQIGAIAARQFGSTSRWRPSGQGSGLQTDTGADR